MRLDEWGFVLTGHDLVHDTKGGGLPAAYAGHAPVALETSVPGIFAAGDVRRGSTKQVASATGEGADGCTAHPRISTECLVLLEESIAPRRHSRFGYRTSPALALTFVFWGACTY